MAFSSHYSKPKFILIVQYLLRGIISSQVIVTVIATLGAIVSGTILGWSSPAQSMFRTDHEFPFPVTREHVHTFNSVFGVGATLGALPAGYVSSLLGRQVSMMLAEGFVFVGWAILVLPTSVWMLYTARVVQGVGVGAMCAVIPAYVGEITEPRMRGCLETIFQFFVVTGILYSYTLGAFMMYELFCVMCAIWVVLHILGVLCIPESPYHLMGKNDSDGAAASLEILRDNSDTTKELASIKSFVEQQKLQNYTIYQVLSNKANRKSLYIGIGCMFFQQMSGINVLIFYMTEIFNSAGSHLNPHTCSITVGVVQLAMTFVALLVVDKCGRKLLLVISGLLMAISHAGLGVFYLIKTQYPELMSTWHNWLPLTCITVYISAFSIGYGPLPWVIMGEIYSPEVKPIGTSLTTCTNWSLVFVVTYLFNELILLWGQAGCFFTFSAFCLMGTVFAAIIVPETKNKTLAEIQLNLLGKQVTSIPMSTMTTATTTTTTTATYETTVFS